MLRKILFACVATAIAAVIALPTEASARGRGGGWHGGGGWDGGGGWHGGGVPPRWGRGGMARWWFPPRLGRRWHWLLSLLQRVRLRSLRLLPHSQSVHAIRAASA